MPRVQSIPETMPVSGKLIKINIQKTNNLMTKHYAVILGTEKIVCDRRASLNVTRKVAPKP